MAASDEPQNGRPGVSRQNMLSSGSLLAIGQAVSIATIFLRNLIVVRAISKVDFGISVTFSVTLTIVSTLGNLGLPSLIIQAKDGDESRFQRTGQFLRAMLGLVLAVSLFFAAPWLAALFGLPELEWAYRLLAVGPLVGAFVHFDCKRFLRQGRYAPEVFVNAGSHVVSLVVVCVLAFFIGDYTLMIYALLAQFGAETLISWIIAQRRYAWSVDGGYGKRLVHFGWPLIVSGGLMLLAMQGEKLIIGSQEKLVEGVGWLTGNGGEIYSKSQLAEFSLAIGLAMMPTLFLGKVIPTLFFPILSKAQSDLPEFERLYLLKAIAMATAATGVVMLFVIAGEPVIVLMYSDRYAGIGPVIAMFGLAQALRVLRFIPTVGALALAKTHVPMWANIARSAGLVAATVCAARGMDIIWIAKWAATGELFALIVATVHFHTVSAVPFRVLIKPGMFFSGWLLAAMGLTYVTPGLGHFTSLAIAVAVGLTAATSALLVFPSLMRGAREVLARVRGGETNA